MKKIIKLSYFIIYCSICSCQEIQTDNNTQKNHENKIALLTNNASRLWVMFEHNFTSASDNTKFITSPPSAFLNIYIQKPVHLLLNKDFTFSLSDEPENWQRVFGKWKLEGEYLILSYLGTKEELNSLEPTQKFKLSKLNEKELYIRLENAPSEKALNYYEFRFH